MLTNPFLMGGTSHIHKCVACGTKIPCDSPDDPGDCTVSALACGECDDVVQDQGAADDFQDVVAGEADSDDFRDEDYSQVPQAGKRTAGRGQSK